jgi:MoaD family protein
MKVKVTFFAMVREAFKTDQIEVEIENESNLRQLFNKLCDSRERRRQIFERSGELNTDIMILRNGKDIRSFDGIQTKLTSGDTIAVFSAIAGG